MYNLTMPYKDLEKRRAYHRAYLKKYAKTHKDALYASTKKWRAKNRERFNAKLYAWRRANPDKAKAMQDRWYKKHGKEYRAQHLEKLHRQEKAYRKKERLLNPQQRKDRKKRYYWNNRERIRSSVRLKHLANPEKNREKDRRRWREQKERRTLQNFKARARRYGVRLYCTQSQWLELLRTFDFKCFYCKIALTKQTRTLDHKIPLSRGGSNEPENLVPCCRTCNSRKHDLTAEEFLARLPDYTDN
jgi:5-methylcytosine-specific restriction endonuclease McrA